MFKFSKKENNGRNSQRIDTHKRQFYTYSSNNRYNTLRDAPVKRDRLKIVKDDVKNDNRTLEKFTSIIIIILLMVCVGYSTTLSADSRLIINKDREVLSNRGSNEYAKSLKGIINNSITNRSKITINTIKISEELKSKYPEITNVEIRLPLVGRRPVVDITTDDIVLVIQANNRSYGVGRSGKLLIESKDQLEVDKNTPVILDYSGIETKIGSNILTSQDVDFILNVIKQFNIKNIGIESILLPKLAAEVHIKPKEANYIIKFNMLTDYKIAVGQYFSLKKKLDNDKVIPSDYIDSRIEERIYYK